MSNAVLDGPPRGQAAFPEVLPAFARMPVCAIAAAVGILLMFVNARYPLSGDELYFLSAGKHYLDWGYMDQQPLVPLLAWAMDAVAPGNAVVFRIPAVLVTMACVAMAALIARELGGDRRAQAIAAGACPTAVWVLQSGQWLAAATVELVQWPVMIWLLVRWTRLNLVNRRDDALLVWFGVVTALAVQTKFQVVVLCAALLVSVAALGPREMLLRRATWFGAAVALVPAVPTLIWQTINGWPALDMSTVVNEQSDQSLFLLNVAYMAGVGVGAVLFAYSIWLLLREPRLRPYRFVGWAAVLLIAFFGFSGGRETYVAALYPALFAFGAVGFQYRRNRRGPSTWSRWWTVGPAFVFSALTPILTLPIYPVEVLREQRAHQLLPPRWKELSAVARQSYQELAPETRERAVIIAEDFHIASALDVYGRERGWSRVYSPHRGYWFFGQPPREAEYVVYVGGKDLPGAFIPRKRLAAVPGQVDPLNKLTVPDLTVTLYERSHVSWDALWPRMRTL